MGKICQSCKQASVEVVEDLNENKNPVELCRGCHHRLVTFSLRPLEWYYLLAHHGRSIEYLSEEYYDEMNGLALRPKEKVLDANKFPAPRLEDVRTDPEELLTYILTRNHWHDHDVVLKFYIHEDLVAAMKQHPKEVLLTVFARRLTNIKDLDRVQLLYRLIGEILGSNGAELIRNEMVRLHKSYKAYAHHPAFDHFVFAVSKCLPPDEGHSEITRILALMDQQLNDVCIRVLRHFKTSLNLDWIEKNVRPPIKGYGWENLAAKSEFSWECAKKWLLSGRPLSLVALNALQLCAAYPKKMPLLNPPTSEELVITLNDYLKKDHVPGVRRSITNLKNKTFLKRLTI